MTDLKCIHTVFPEVFILEPKVYSDERGFFVETYNESKLKKHGVYTKFIQDNHSRSIKGTLRGLHYQLKHPQVKLVSVICGEVMDVVVDIRKGSSTYLQHITVVLSEENQRSLYIPKGFAHGFYTCSDIADFCYKCSDIYYPEDSYGVKWDDPILSIPWPGTHPLLSKKDKELPYISSINPDFLPLYQK